jgi:hypothetical protein
VLTTETQTEVDGVSKVKDRPHYDLITQRNIFVFREKAPAKDARPPPLEEPKKTIALSVRLASYKLHLAPLRHANGERSGPKFY